VDFAVTDWFLLVSFFVSYRLEGIRKNIADILEKFEKPYDVLNLIRIDSSSILHNYDHYVGLNPVQNIFPVLKSNAYGHGLKPMVSILKDRNFPYLVVDGYFEALRIWEEWERPVLLIGYVDPVNYRVMKMKNLTLAVWDHETVTALRNIGEPVKVHIKVDTGMHRQGLYVDDLADFINFIKKYPNIEIEGLMSHLADADSPDPSYTSKQEMKFNEAVMIARKLCGDSLKYIHIGASAGSISSKSNDANSFRLGLGLYGYNPLSIDHEMHNKLAQLRPALTLTSKIVTVKDLKKGDKVSYNGTFTADRDVRIGVLPLGYYEALDRRLSNKGTVRYKGLDLPILGRVCMNLTVIGLDETDAKVMDEVEVIGTDRDQKNSIEHMASICETIPYEILVNLSESVRRVVV
jgi:alanine racemase